MTYSVTNIQFFDLTKSALDRNGEEVQEVSYSANITINDKFIIQVAGSLEEAEAASIPHPNLGTFWNNEADQLSAYEELDASDIEAAIEAAGFENNFHYLSENES